MKILVLLYDSTSLTGGVSVRYATVVFCAVALLIAQPKPLPTTLLWRPPSVIRTGEGLYTPSAEQMPRALCLPAHARGADLCRTPWAYRYHSILLLLVRIREPNPDAREFEKIHTIKRRCRGNSCVV